jgi:hypothetical protein
MRIILFFEKIHQIRAGGTSLHPEEELRLFLANFDSPRILAQLINKELQGSKELNAISSLGWLIENSPLHPHLVAIRLSLNLLFASQVLKFLDQGQADARFELKTMIARISLKPSAPLNAPVWTPDRIEGPDWCVQWSRGL